MCFAACANSTGAGPGGDGSVSDGVSDGVDSSARDAAFDEGPPDLGDPLADADGDGLTDREEGLAEGVDADGDGTPDGLDLDSDDNGRSDSLDAFRDSSGALGDLDGDGVLDFRDADDDGDGIPDVVELGPNPVFPRDTDADGIPDFRDVDSDGDSIRDADEFNERTPDADGDGTPNELDLDSDSDGVPDAVEAGDADLDTPPVDTDGDFIPDFLDLDSDNDGVPDSAENRVGSSPVRADTDGDGEGDSPELYLGTDVNDPEDSARARGWLAFFVPFRAPPTPEVLAAALTYDVPASGLSGRVRVQLTDVDRGAQFIERVEVDATTPGCAALGAVDTDGDGEGDAFDDPAAGSRLCWRVVVRPNRTVPANSWNFSPACDRRPVFEASLAVVTDSETAPAQRVFAIVPADCNLIGPDDSACTSCAEDDPCRGTGACPCLCGF
ncbi:MAG: hypothetical protein AAF447_05605 [Myxococcota bacterium]